MKGNGADKSEEYMHQVTVIEPKWLSEVAPTFFKVADQNRISKRKQQEKIEPLFDRFAETKDSWVSHCCRFSTDGSVCQSRKSPCTSLRPSKHDISRCMAIFSSLVLWCLSATALEA